MNNNARYTSTSGKGTRSSKRKVSGKTPQENNLPEAKDTQEQPNLPKLRPRGPKVVESAKVSDVNRSKGKGLNSVCQKKLSDLSPDVLEEIAKHLDTDSALAFLQTCKTIYDKLLQCGSFWKHLCANENFYEYASLRQQDPESESESEDETVSKHPRYSKKLNFLPGKKMTYTCEKLHNIKIPEMAPIWRKIFLRGIKMRRNICQGRFELWRLFLTDGESLPVKQMNQNTSFRELRSLHRGSTYNRADRRVRIIRYWNEEFLIAIQRSLTNAFFDVFVWGWNECQNPRFLYTHSFKDTYATGFSSTAFFLWKNYLVLMPDTECLADSRSVRSMIRIHNLRENMKVVGSYDFPEESGRKRIVKPRLEDWLICETSHLHKIHDKAVALCQAPNLSLFIFSLPQGDLIQEIPVISNPQKPLESYVLDQRFIMRDHTFFFMFHHRDFYGNMFIDDDGDQNPESSQGMMLFVDFEKYVTNRSQPIEMRIDEKFENYFDRIEKMVPISKDLFACILTSGVVVLRDIHPINRTRCTHIDKLVIPCPGILKQEEGSSWSVSDELETDGPFMCASKNGERLVVMRHFVEGRKIHAYDVRGQQVKDLYQIDLDDWKYELDKEAGILSVDMDGNFLCAADLNKIVIWNSRTGKYIRTIKIAPHYNVANHSPTSDSDYWKGHTDFAFAEDGIIIIHSHRNFPVAADIMLFW